jgi:hypothetical protein
MRLMKYGVEVTLNDMTFLLNFTKIYQMVQVINKGGGTQMDRQNGDIISLLKESRLIRDKCKESRRWSL